MCLGQSHVSPWFLLGLFKGQFTVSLTDPACPGVGVPDWLKGLGPALF